MSNDREAMRAQRFAEIGTLIRESAVAIIDRWASAAAASQDSAKATHRQELRNHLPIFLEQVGESLLLPGKAEAARDASAKHHGRQRWENGWHLDEVIRDYQLLRVALLDHLDERLTRRLSLEEIKAIGLMLDDAIEEAAVTFVDYQEHSLLEAQRQTQATFHNAAVGIAHLDLEGRCLRANERLCRMLGVQQAGVEGANIEEIVHSQDAETLRQELQNLLAGRDEPFVCELRLLSADRLTSWSKATASLHRTQGGDALFYILVLEDLSHREQLHAELQHAKAAAEEGSRLKSEFVANVSHEIRTPMNAILGMTELALDEELTPELEDYLKTAHDSARSLLSLVNDLLDFSRMESGKLELESTSFDLWATIDETAKALSISAAEKGLELLTDVAEAVPRYGKGDPLRLRQVITNLVSNAIKFTERGEVVIRATLEAETASHSTIRFAIVDTGIGISTDDMRRIFAPFTQADASTTRVFGGSGLGLAICTELISRLGGKLDVKSEAGKGSEFFFSARFEKAEAPSELAERRRSRLLKLQGQRVLIIDDNATSREILAEMLSQMSVQVESIDCAEAALHHLRMAAKAGASYDVILVDALMPGKDGFSVVEEINLDQSLDSTVVLMLSSADRSTFTERTKGLKLDGFLDKPVARRDLLEVISAASGAADQDDVAAQSGAAVPSPLKVLVVEDTPANQKVVRAILRKRGHSVTMANNGREALEIIDAETFDVVLMDVQMPTLDGYQATAMIRGSENPSAAETPILAMTAHAMKGDAEKCLTVGMNDYISKPIDSKRLVELVEKWGCPEAGDWAPSPDPAQRSASSPLRFGGRIADFDAALHRLDGNRQLLDDMIGFFREDVPQLLKNLDAGLAAAEAASVRRAAHSIKGLAASFEAERVVREAVEVEKLASHSELDPVAPRVASLRAAIGELELAFQEFARSSGTGR